ncbi:MAG TPA: Ku protein [Acidobacteriota bacterium]|nr:Ku protein [Acidobacteriota bacterium]
MSTVVQQRTARAIWKGVIELGTLQLPVKLYSAVEDRTVHFRLLHRKDKQPVRQMMVNSETGEEVPKEQIRKGAEVEPGVFVMLHDEELNQLEPEPSRTISVKRFLPPEKINHQWYDRPYYLGPDGDDDRLYWDLVEALERQKKEGVVRWVMRKKNYAGALRVDQGYLMLITLRPSQEVVLAEDLEPPTGRELEKKELEMAKQLVGAMMDEFRHEEFRDEFRDKVSQLIEAKARGKKIKLVKPKKKAGQESLEKALEASLAAVRKRKHA